MTEKELNKNYIKGIILASNGNEELLINEIQKLCSKQYIEGLEQGKFDATMDAQQREESLIKYLEDEISRLNSRWRQMAVHINRSKDVLPRIESKTSAYQEILEMVKSSKYE